ncbi:MAG: outer membrane beta-barrel protein [Planctomycetaceae bacterium]|jgi:hypothetical protein|nr:outer membrane beta-barrel protein [Planctomycetaceae bacterium]
MPVVKIPLDLICGNQHNPQSVSCLIGNEGSGANNLIIFKIPKMLIRQFAHDKVIGDRSGCREVQPVRLDYVYSDKIFRFCFGGLLFFVFCFGLADNSFLLSDEFSDSGLSNGAVDDSAVDNSAMDESNLLGDASSGGTFLVNPMQRYFGSDAQFSNDSRSENHQAAPSHPLTKQPKQTTRNTAKPKQKSQQKSQQKTQQDNKREIKLVAADDDAGEIFGGQNNSSDGQNNSAGGQNNSAGVLGNYPQLAMSNDDPNSPFNTSAPNPSYQPTTAPNNNPNPNPNPTYPANNPDQYPAGQYQAGQYQLVQPYYQPLGYLPPTANYPQQGYAQPNLPPDMLQYYAQNPQLYSPNLQPYSQNPQYYSPYLQPYAPNLQPYAPNLQYYSPDPQLYSPNLQSYMSNPQSYGYDSGYDPRLLQGGVGGRGEAAGGDGDSGEGGLDSLSAFELAERRRLEAEWSSHPPRPILYPVLSKLWSCFVTLSPFNTPTGADRGVGMPLRNGSWLDRPYYFGGFVGKISGSELVSNMIDQGSGANGGLILGYNMNEYWGLEGRLHFASIDIRETANGADQYVMWALANNPTLTYVPGLTTRSNQLTVFDLSVHYYPLGNAKFRPYFKYGLGFARESFYDTFGEKRSAETLSMPFGFGLRYWWNKRFAIHLEAVDNIIFSHDIVKTQGNWSFVVGLTYSFGNSNRRRPVIHWPHTPSSGSRL